MHFLAVTMPSLVVAGSHAFDHKFCHSEPANPVRNLLAACSLSAAGVQQIPPCGFTTRWDDKPSA
jgi:hypothetical protein